MGFNSGFKGLTGDWYCDNMGTVTEKRRGLSVEKKTEIDTRKES